ncbi:MAG: 30S ribosomal protein S5 [Candidatus Berkelbacteria bacterium]|nr:MAG: 30S ribosomal protein S5 [Candidatus Berkelbacteria bacterium]QQG52109.1 MAG: 30S ribosomal protein S5 [Candidatus Berkelbacteria bacterium]
MTRDETKEILEETTVSAPEPSFDHKVIAIDRISRTVAGGRRIRFRAMVVVGNLSGKVGVATAKANDVQGAIAKATNAAMKTVIVVPLTNDTIPHQVSYTFGTTAVLLKPAPKGHSIIAGGAVRPVLELAGVKNIVSKALGSSNTLNSAMATYHALKILKARNTFVTQRGKS